MNTINWPILHVSHVTPKVFVLFWERLYPDLRYNEDFYRANIGQPLTEERIVQWFLWKNGTPLSPKKSVSIRRYLLPEERIGKDGDDESLTAFLNRPGGAIWRIFWLHLQHPQNYPIYDQHVHRAMAYLLKFPQPEIPVHNPKKVRGYLDSYRPFFKSFAACENRAVDRALWAFGRFLSSDSALVLGT
jgi:hypothetical protein